MKQNTKIIATVPAAQGKEEFIKAMQQLWAEANVAYRNIYDTVAVPNWTAWNTEYVKQCLAGAVRTATEYAAKKWKTAKRQAKYVEEYVGKREAELLARTAPKYEPLTFADFDVEPWRNGLSGNCVLSKFTDEELARCWETIHNNKYFKTATAFSIGYLDSNDQWRTYYDGLCGFRPQVIMTMPEEMEKAYEADEKALADDIARFYANCHYCGD